jgi:type III restriction enzyme
VTLDPEQLGRKTVTVVSQSQIASRLGLLPDHVTGSTLVLRADGPPLFPKPEEQKVAQIAYEIIRRLENQPERVPAVSHLQHPEIRAAIVQEVAAAYQPSQLAIDAVVTPPDIAAVVARTTEFMAQQSISIPRILVVPTGEVKSGFHPFALKVDSLNYPPVSEELWVQYLRTGGTEVVALERGGSRRSDW